MKDKGKIEKFKSIRKQLKDSNLKKSIDTKIKQLENGDKRVNK